MKRGDATYIAYLALFALLVVIVGSVLELHGFREAAVERGYALYCPESGKWAWKGECEK